MKRTLWILVAFCLGTTVSNAMATETARPSGAEVNANGIQVHNLATAFVTFWDGTRKLAPEDQVAAFKREVADKFPAFYGVARFDGRITQTQRDANILRAIEAFGPIRETFVAKVTDFDAQLQTNIESFRQTFPEFRPDIPVYVLHSLGEMDGGTRELEGKHYLIFGVDVMVRTLKPPSDASAFFHHELFHVLHEPLLGPCEELWCSLWTEGLAVHVAKTLHPEASDEELLLAFPIDLVPSTEARRREALAHLRDVLARTDEATYASLFQGGSSANGLPARHGYLLGLWVAQELARNHSLQALSRMRASEVRPLVFAAVDKLLAETKP